MNRSSEILNYLSSPDAPGVVVLAPNAPPVSRGIEGIQVALSIVLSAEDVNETLMALRTMAPSAGSVSLSSSGTFSFGVSDVGRFKVNYVTQRGSKVVSITRIPFAIPDSGSICDDSAVIEQLFELVSSDQGGILTVFGPSEINNSLLVYSLLKRVNQTAGKMLCILERSITFLMGHGNSIVIQSELGTDVQSMEEGVQNAFLFEPDILYVGNIRSSDELPSVFHAVETGVVTILSSVAMNGRMLLKKFRPRFEDAGGAEQVKKKIVKVLPAEGGKLSIELIS